MSPALALEGISVLDLASVGPGARASRILSDYGAEVVKIGPVPSREGVQIAPPLYAYSGHRLMRRALFDLKSENGRDVFMALASDADVIIESFRPGVVDRLGIGYEAVCSVNPAIIYCSTSGFGQSGPKSAWAGHDLNYLALSGYLHCSGRQADGSPALPGATVADIAAGGMQAAMATMAALVARQRSGEGRHLDVSIADGAFAMMSLYIDEHLATGSEPGPGHNILTGRYACYGVYTCADGRFLSVAAIEARFWRNLCSALDLDRFAESQMDDSRQQEIRDALVAVFATRSRDDWSDLLGPANCCVAPVLTVGEAVEDPHYMHRRVVVEAEHADEGPFRQTSSVWAGTGSPSRPYEVRDATVTDTRQLLQDIGFDEESIEALVEEGVVA